MGTPRLGLSTETRDCGLRNQTSAAPFSKHLDSASLGAGNRETEVSQNAETTKHRRKSYQHSETNVHRDKNMSHPPRTHRGQRDRERNGEHTGGVPRDNREGRGRRDYHEDRPPPSDSSSQPPYYDRSPPPLRQTHRSTPQEEHHGSKCTNICSRRGIVLICAVLTNALVLVCVVAAHLSMSGFSSAGLSGGGFSINAQIPFQGTELQQVRDLDMQFSQMRAPGVYGGVAFSLTMGVLSLLFVVSGSKPAYLQGKKLLVSQFLFQLIGGVAYVVAVGLYLHFVIKVNATDVCQRRERLYAGRGLTYMNCNVGGGDVAVALFGLITAILYAAGTYLTFVTMRNVAHYHKRTQGHTNSRSQI
ncbi:MARVEL domain-containing protein 3 [Alosa pseudoharengus]|uniref:MARVEL domain-containing protein 3 n=1 Tax=Alosa pseudoharengus TaxID=34774 RepID=UPI003F8ABA65